VSARLVLSVRDLDGRFHGQGVWPPDPARLFQALVAGAARGAKLPEAAKKALLWLERLDPPVIAAPPARQTRAVKLYVPNNDADAKLDTDKGGYSGAVAQLRSAKEVRPWLFDNGIPLHYLWTVADGAGMPEGLEDVVQALYRLGCGVDPAFAVAELLGDGKARELLERYPGAIYRPGYGTDHRTPCSGTLDSLERRHVAFTGRFSRVDGKLAFRQPPKPRLRLIGYETPAQHILYHLRVTGSGAFMPLPLTRAASVTEELLSQAAERLVGGSQDEALVARQVLGKDAGEAEKTERVRLIPLPSAGHEHTDPSIRRMLLEVPPGCRIQLRDLDWAFGTLTPHHPETGEARNWRLERADERDPVLRHYADRSRHWRTITPVVLSAGRRRNHDKERSIALKATAHAVRQAVRHAGIRAAVREVRVQPEPFRRRGARAQDFVLPQRLGHQQPVHVEIIFNTLVQGPLVFGNGRYRGLGLFEPVRDVRDRFLFALRGTEPADAQAIAAAARRAIMARVCDHRNHLEHRDLPAFFTGHETDGDPIRDGGRAHLAVLVDTVAGQILVASPQALDHRFATGEEARHTRELADALEGFDRLVAGPAGAFVLSPLPESTGRLIGKAQVWQTVTDWTPCRHGKSDPAVWVPVDIRTECHRRGLPKPEVDILELRQGPRKGIRARLRLRFAVAVGGPIALGRTAMKGGGVFVATGE